MNRCALCLEMLKLLKARGKMSRQELAECLSTNVRNLAEFKKELETAGYYIESTTGKYGGYQLLEDYTLAVPAFTSAEQDALNEAVQYLDAHPDFAYQDAYRQAMDKILCASHDREKQIGVYLEGTAGISQQMLHYIEVCKEAIAKRLAIRMVYRSLNSQVEKELLIQPYELVFYEQSYYVIAYVGKYAAFRTYKFSDERMKQFQISNHSFTRDLDFRLQDHVGKGIMKEEAVELKLSVYDEMAILVSEQCAGLILESKWQEDGGYYLHVLLEGNIQVERFLLSLGSHVVLHEPIAWRQRIQTVLSAMEQRWNESK